MLFIGRIETLFYVTDYYYGRDGEVYRQNAGSPNLELCPTGFNW